MVPAVSSPASAAECVSVPLSSFGSSPLPINHEPDEEGYRCLLVTTNAAGPYLVDSAVSRVYRPDGTRVEEVFPGRLQAFLLYELAADTTYRMLVPSDTFAAHEVLAGDGCPQLADLTWAADEDLSTSPAARPVARRTRRPARSFGLQVPRRTSRSSSTGTVTGSAGSRGPARLPGAPSIKVPGRTD